MRLATSFSRVIIGFEQPSQAWRHVPIHLYVAHHSFLHFFSKESFGSLPIRDQHPAPSARLL
jgi:hypothetical protein